MTTNPNPNGAVLSFYQGVTTTVFQETIQLVRADFAAGSCSTISQGE